MTEHMTGHQRTNVCLVALQKDVRTGTVDLASETEMIVTAQERTGEQSALGSLQLLRILRDLSGYVRNSATFL